MPVRTVIERGPKDKRAVAFSRRLAGLEPRREERRGRPGDARVVSGALSADRGPRRDGARVRRRRVARDRGGQGRYRFDRLLGHLVRGHLRPSMDRWARRSSTARSRCCAPAGRSSTASRRGSRRRCARARAEEDATATGSSATPSVNESEDFAKRVGLRDPGGRRRLTPDGLRAASGDLRRGDARLQRRRGRAAHAEHGRCRSSSGTRPSTRSTTRGRWRTRTSPAEDGA